MGKIIKTITSKYFEGSNSRKGVQRLTLMIVALAMMILAPSSVRGAVYNFDWHYWLNAATNAYLYDSGTDTNCSGVIIMSGNDYEDIEGAQTVTRVQYRAKNNNTGNYGTSKNEVYERLAFVLNTEGKANAYNGNNGWYLRAEPNGNGGYYHRALYTGCQGSKLAILSLRGGDKVTITFEAGDHVASYGAGIHYNQSVHCYQEGYEDAYNETGAYFRSGDPIYITSSGDLIVDANIGTYITDIKIETADIAKYKIETSTDNKTSTFEFTSNGVLEDNDFTVPHLAFSMGSVDDYLNVQNLEAHMIRGNGSEDLVTDPNNYFQPSGGSFYAFKPSAKGTITINEGSIQGDNIHVFVFNPTSNQWEGENGKFYKYTFYSLPFNFPVEKGKIYYICQDNQNESGNALHLKKFTFTTNYYVKDLGVVIDNVDSYSSEGTPIELTEVNPAGNYTLTVKRCTGNISNASELTATITSDNKLYMSKPTFTSGTDHAGTVIWNLEADGGNDAIVVTFPYHANFDNGSDPHRTSGHIWNFIDPRLSDSNISNCQDGNGNSVGTASGILSIGRDKDSGSQFHQEVQNREWTYAQRVTGEAGGFHDPMYKNVWDMVGDNADMIWETEGLIFETSPLLSCLYNENDAKDPSVCNPVDAAGLGGDPDRYVGLMPIANEGEYSKFTIPGLQDEDRVLIYMKSGEGSSDNGIFLNITGAKDAIGNPISSSDLYKALGTNYLHDRYEGCYHFIKDGPGNMTFTLNGGSMCKIMYIRIYTGARVITNNLVSKNTAEDDNAKLLLINDKDATVGSTAQFSLRFTGKGQFCGNKVLTYSGSINKDGDAFSSSNYVVSGKYNQFVDFTSKVGEVGMLRLRMTDLEHSGNYVADFIDKNITVGYRDKVDSYPYTWDFTDIQGFSSSSMTAEANNYPETSKVNLEKNQHIKDGFEISLFDSNGYMKVNSGVDPNGHNNIFDSHRIGFGNQLWAGSDVIPETRGLWFYTDDNDPNYNNCLQITSEGISFCNIPDADGKHKPWWNYKMVVPDVPANAAVYLRMKRDSRIADTDKMYSDIDGKNVLFLNTRFAFGTSSKTSLSEDGNPYKVQENGSGYSFYQVPGTTDEYILAIKNTTGAANHLQFTLNGWIVEKLAISEDAKAVNSKGWTSESRVRDIDASLTAYMTGKEMKTYLVGSPNHTNRTLVLTDISGSEANYVLPANTGCVMFNATDESKAEILDGGFHLFVPDMHDGEKVASTTGNLMKVNFVEAQVIPDSEGDLTNYVLAYKYYQLDENGNKVGDAIEGDEMFYRAANTGIKLHTNSAYLQLPTADVKPKGAAGAKYTFLFAEYDEENAGTSTAIEEIETISTDAVNDESKAQWYNLNGQKLNGKPSARGIYIRDGKKVYIK